MKAKPPRLDLRSDGEGVGFLLSFAFCLFAMGLATGAVAAWLWFRCPTP